MNTLREKQYRRRNDNWIPNCPNDITGIVVYAISIPLFPLFKSIFLDLFEMMENIYYNENRYTNLLGLAATIIVVAAAIYFLAPVVLPILAAATTWALVGYGFAGVVALASLVKGIKFLFDELGKCFNNNQSPNLETRDNGFSRGLLG